MESLLYIYIFINIYVIRYSVLGGKTGHYININNGQHKDMDMDKDKDKTVQHCAGLDPYDPTHTRSTRVQQKQ